MTDSSSNTILSVLLLCGTCLVPMVFGGLVAWQARSRWDAHGWWAFFPESIRIWIERLRE